MADGTQDTSHLYEGKTVRSAAPSRKKAAGRLKSSTEIPKDAIPEIHVPSWIESFFGGPIVSSMKFLPANKTVSTLQIASAGVLLLLSFLTYVITPVSGTAWFTIANIVGMTFLGGLIHILILVVGLIGGIYGIFQRDQRALLVSYVMLLLITLRFAGSKVEFGLNMVPENEIAQKVLLILYALFLVMYFELTSGIIRFSMLDTSIRTGEVYVMGEGKIISQYNRAIGITPAIAGLVALITLLINLIIPAIVGIFDDVAANRLSESVELTSVYGVALGTAMVFTVVAAAFAINLPLRIQKMREKQN
ncbi:MAG TPA: hypothetical protein QGF70_03410 [Candidatus Thalassarchaeaceae archaeon]|nr:hypothetical protein [Candidatus Thalassarchaeaceae archaeon]MDP7658396.1 hypothetical protein [Candidatus Thalassarchaeaceae archaeon]HJL64615.1 hypothetical protein [Candidatus Thalassarchaeaceae archaeon]HJO42184.1 hypothetical protein [Candidatus Thalassarchaeaceae archaeon]